MYKGVALSILASVSFGILYFYTQFLSPLDSEQVFAWRILATLPFLIASRDMACQVSPPVAVNKSFD